jgi:hypothetical protein
LISRTTSRFREAYRRLPERVQRRTREVYRRLKDNPQHPSSTANTCTLPGRSTPHGRDSVIAPSAHARVKVQTAIEWGPEVYAYRRREFAFRDPDGNSVIVSEVTSDPLTCADS